MDQPYKPEPHSVTVREVIDDSHVSGKFGFVLHDEDGITVFRSGLVYSTKADATQAADDAIIAALSWRDDNYMNLDLWNHLLFNYLSNQWNIHRYRNPYSHFE